MQDAVTAETGRLPAGDEMKTKKEQGSEPDAAEARFSDYAKPLIDEANSSAAALRSDSDADVLHRLRVALRRLRTLLWAYRPLLGEELEGRQGDRFRSLAGAAGKTRDWDILIELLSDALGEKRAPTERLLSARAAALSDSRERLAHAGINSELQDALNDANDTLRQMRKPTPLKKFARKRVAAAEKSLHKRMRRARGAKGAEYTSYHDVRKAGKKVRYLLEFFEPLLSRKQLKTLKGLKKLQKRFGALNDVVASEELLRGNSRDIFSNSRSVATALAALEKQRKRRIRAAAKLL